MPSPERHILLVGFMGSGKSTVGPLLAERLKMPYEELDARIEERYNLSISEIFKSYEESAFRQAEGWELRRLLLDPPSVIALGGGAFNPKNRLNLPADVFTIWLDVSLELAWQRCRNDPTRPLASRFGDFCDLYRRRLQADYQSARLRIEVGGMTPHAIVEQVLQQLGTGRSG